MKGKTVPLAGRKQSQMAVEGEEEEEEEEKEEEEKEEEEEEVVPIPTTLLNRSKNADKQRKELHKQGGGGGGGRGEGKGVRDEAVPLTTKTQTQVAVVDKEEEKKDQEDDDDITPLPTALRSKNVFLPPGYQRSIVQRRVSAPPTTSSTVTPTSLSLAVFEGSSAPGIMSRGSSTLLSRITAIFSSANTLNRNVYACHFNSFSKDVNWENLPQCPRYEFGLTTINGRVTAVGGYKEELQASKPTNTLLTLSEANSSGRWEEKLQPMPTKRRLPAVTMAGTLLVVAGGQGVRNEILTTVEVLNTRTAEWSTTYPLPIPLAHASITTTNQYVYISGGRTDDGPTQATFRSQLRSRDPFHSLRDTDPPSPSLWQWLPDAPAFWCTLATLDGHLLALGGQDRNKTCSGNIVAYVPNSNVWATIGRLKQAHSASLTAVFLGETLLVVGGHSKKHQPTKTVEVITWTP